MIAKSKKFKYERQKEKEQLLNEFEKFDEEFKSIRSLTKDFDRTADQKVCFSVKLLVFLLRVFSTMIVKRRDKMTFRV